MKIPQQRKVDALLKKYSSTILPTNSKGVDRSNPAFIELVYLGRDAYRALFKRLNDRGKLPYGVEIVIVQALELISYRNNKYTNTYPSWFDTRDELEVAKKEWQNWGVKQGYAE
jgi:hypothetical protein